MNRRTLDRLVLPAALGVYLARVAAAVAAHRDEINPDAICYIRNALYLTEGRFWDAVAGYWSPLVSWCIAPAVALGADGLHALYVVLALWGGVLVVASDLFIRRFAGLSAGWRLAALLLIGDATLRWGATAFPDVILASCLMAACASFCDDRFPDSRWQQVVAGVWGGIGYLGKAYGLPYFCVLLPLSIVLLHALPSDLRQQGRIRRLLSAWAVAMLAFGVVSGPWVAALSWKYGHPTFGLVGAINHAIVGPHDFARDELWEAVPGRITVWEIPETRTYAYWSPFESGENFRHQVGYAAATARLIRGSLARFDLLSLSLGLLPLAPLLLLALGEPAAGRRALWVLAAVASYCAPFTLVYYDYRYPTPFLKPLCIVACLAFAQVAGRRLPGRWARVALAGLVVLSFAAYANIPFRPYVVEEVDGTPFNNIVVDSKLHRRLATTLRDEGGGGPVASSLYWGGLFTSFFMDRPFVGTPAGASLEACKAEMKARGVRTLLVDPQWRFATELRQDPDWIRTRTLDASPNESVEVFTPRAP